MGTEPTANLGCPDFISAAQRTRLVRHGKLSRAIHERILVMANRPDSGPDAGVEPIWGFGDELTYGQSVNRRRLVWKPRTFG